MSEENLISIFINDKEVQVPAGINVIEAAAKAGVEIPHYCYHKHLPVVGNCRMCLIEMGMPGRDRATGEPILDENGVQKIMWMPKPVIACASNVSPGMHIRTDSDVIKKCREGVMEFLLVNHPLDCPICDQAGECRLQEFATDYGRGYSRFVEEKNVKPKRTKLGPRVMLDDERCILCGRCVRFCRDVAKDGVLGFTERGSYSTLTCFPGKQLENNYSLNTVDLCPVGALTSIDFRFKMRTWFLKPTKSICTESSVGVNTVVDSREGVIHRIRPRDNDDVNDSWMPDSGRMLYKQVATDNRMENYTIEGTPVSALDALEKAIELLKTGKVGIVGSAKSSVEEQWMLKEIVRSLGEDVPTWLVAHNGEGDDFLISKDRTPNLRGALLTGLTDSIPSEQLTDLSAKIDSGEIDTLFVYGECPVCAGLTEDQVKKVKLIYMGSHHCDASQFAAVEIPSLTVFEKKGTFVNQQFRLQKFDMAVPATEGIFDDLESLSVILGELSGAKTTPNCVDSVWISMQKDVTAFEGLSYKTLSDTGVLVDGSAFDQLAFVDGKSLHFEPKA